MIEYNFICDGCGLRFELDDLDISTLAPLPKGWRRIHLSFPADKEGEESQLFADHWEDEPESEICVSCVQLIKKVLHDPDLPNITDEEREQLLKILTPPKEEPK